MGRKTARDGGQLARAIAAVIEKTEAALQVSGSMQAVRVAARLAAARLAFTEVVDFVVAHVRDAPNAVFAGSVPYLMLAGNLVAGWQLARSLLVAEQLAAQGIEPTFMAAKVATAHFYAEHVLVQAPALRDRITQGADSVCAMALDAF